MVDKEIREQIIAMVHREVVPAIGGRIFVKQKMSLE